MSRASRHRILAAMLSACLLSLLGGCTPLTVLAVLGGCKDGGSNGSSGGTTGSVVTGEVRDGMTIAQTKAWFNGSDGPDNVCQAYPDGQCTWWACMRGHKNGLDVGSYWGNGGDWAASATAAEEAAEDIAEPAAEQIVEVDIAAAAASRAGNGAEPVVLRALVRVAENVVSFVELFELVLGIGGLVHVRVQFTRLATKRLLDIRLRGITGDAENFVQVLRHVGRIHLSIPQRAILPGSYKSPSAVPAMRTARNTFE